MRKRIPLIVLILILILVTLFIPKSGLLTSAPSFDGQNNPEMHTNGIPISVAHRTAWRDAPECSILAVYNAIQMGIDVFELDIQLSSDGKLVLFHDSSIDRTVVGRTGSPDSYTLEQLRTMPLEMSQGNSTAHILTSAESQILNSISTYVADCGQAQERGCIYVNTLEDILVLMQKYAPNAMINLDKCDSESKFVASYLLLREYDMLDNVYIKSSLPASTMESWYNAAAIAWNEKHPEDQLTKAEVCSSILYVYVLGDVSTSAISEHLNNNGNLVMVEICIEDDVEDDGMYEIVEPWCKENKVAMFVNTMWSGLCSTKEDTETTWAEMLDRGYTAIQTDQPKELSEYLQAYNNGHNSTDIIEAEHFHLFNYEDYGLKVAEVADLENNKKVTEIKDGDWMRYEKITFQGNENAITLNLCGLNNSGTLSVYLDDQTTPIAELALSASTTYSNLTIFLADKIDAGIHSVTLKVTGLPGTNLLSMDSFTFDTVEFSGSQ